MVTEIADALLFIMPAYFANSAPVVLGGGRPLDLGKSMPDGRRVFGAGKTVRGAVLAVIVGTAVALVVATIASNFSFFPLASTLTVELGFLLALGTVAGDVLGSFIKRRVGMKRGAPFPVLDQMGFVVVALLFASASASISLFPLAIILIATPIIHVSFNVIAYLLKLKPVPY